MANYQLGPVIGKLGGSSVETIPVSASSTQVGRYPLASIDVPEGETWLIAVDGQMQTPGVMTENGGPWLRIGDTTSYWVRSSRQDCLVTEASGSVDVELEVRWAHSSGTSFTGTVYTVPLT